MFGSSYKIAKLQEDIKAYKSRIKYLEEKSSALEHENMSLEEDIQRLKDRHRLFDYDKEQKVLNVSEEVLTIVQQTAKFQDIVNRKYASNIRTIDVINKADKEQYLSFINNNINRLGLKLFKALNDFTK